MIQSGVDPKWTGLLATVAGTFAVVYLVQARYQYRSTHWPKPLMHLCLGIAALSAALPSIKFLVDLSPFGKLETIIDNSSWTAVPFVIAAVVFGWLQVLHERSGHHTS
jgi:lysylphosphatidylglycerol synthetase-like protein (DUF2156 family)